MDIENKIRQRLDLQETRRQQLEFKEHKLQAEKQEEEEFRRKVTFYSISHFLLCSNGESVPSIIARLDGKRVTKVEQQDFCVPSFPLS